MASVPSNKAFTLVELLTVVAILGLLVSVLLPAMGKAVEAANATRCLTNIRNMGLAAGMYVNDNDGALPSVGVSRASRAVDEQGSWFHLLELYAGEPLLFRCPSDRSVFFDRPVDPKSGRIRKVSYAVNYFVSGQMTNYEQYHRLSQLPHPDKTIFALELYGGDSSRDARHNGFVDSDYIHAQWTAGDPEGVREQARTEVAYDRHLGRSNYLFTDGHVESLLLEQVYQKALGAALLKPNWVHNKFNPLIAR